MLPVYDWWFLTRRGVKVIFLTQVSNQTKKHLVWLKRFVEVRHTDSKARFCIVDGKEIIFMVLDDSEVHPTYDVGIWFSAPFAKDLVNFV